MIEQEIRATIERFSLFVNHLERAFCDWERPFGIYRSNNFHRRNLEFMSARGIFGGDHLPLKHHAGFNENGL